TDPSHITKFTPLLCRLEKPPRRHGSGGAGCSLPQQLVPRLPINGAFGFSRARPLTVPPVFRTPGQIAASPSLLSRSPMSSVLLVPFVIMLRRVLLISFVTSPKHML